MIRDIIYFMEIDGGYLLRLVVEIESNWHQYYGVFCIYELLVVKTLFYDYGYFIFWKIDGGYLP